MKWHLLFACCLSCWVLHAQSDSLNALAITDLIAAYAEARQSQNPQKISLLFSEDADQLVSSGVWRQGRTALVEGMLRSSQTNPGDRSLEVERVRFLSPTVAIADARYTIGQRKMWSTFLVVKSEKEWRITAIRNMLPARAN
ncbi:MAG: SgcJ/EcaC family oxidoreductase [Saprospiraceae bacterium]|nr:SgcJ/EcaC family oxidoreductase [Saprospiraceae bacterium]